MEVIMDSYNGSQRSVRMSRTRGLVTLGLGACLLAAGCNNAAEGALSGAAIGALGGLAIGSLTGGSGTGAATGAVIGDQNKRNDERARDRYNDDW
jgi:hypothetical protein